MSKRHRRHEEDSAPLYDFPSTAERNEYRRSPYHNDCPPPKKNKSERPRVNTHQMAASSIFGGTKLNQRHSLIRPSQPEQLRIESRHQSQQPFRHDSARCYTNDTNVATLPYPAEGIEVVYTTSPQDVDKWVKRNIQEPRTSAIGVDIEWKPNFVAKKAGGVDNRTATLQLAVGRSCLVIHVCHMSMETLPSSLADVLRNTNIAKAGSGIDGDAVKLLNDTGLFIDGRADTQAFARAIGLNKSDGLGLKKLAKSILDFDFEKPFEITMSNWESFRLTEDQVCYAALDAWIGLKLFEKLKRKVDRMPPQDRKVNKEELITTGTPGKTGLVVRTLSKQSARKQRKRQRNALFAALKEASDDSSDEEPEERENRETVPSEPSAPSKRIKLARTKSLLVFSRKISCLKCDKEFQGRVSKNHKKKCKGRLNQPKSTKAMADEEPGHGKRELGVSRKRIFTKVVPDYDESSSSVQCGREFQARVSKRSTQAMADEGRTRETGRVPSSLQSIIDKPCRRIKMRLHHNPLSFFGRKKISPCYKSCVKCGKKFQDGVSSNHKKNHKRKCKGVNQPKSAQVKRSFDYYI